MGNVKAGVGKITVCASQSERCSAGRLSAAARLDCMYAQLATAALYYWFGELHRHGTPSRALAAALMFSPLIAGSVLALRGHLLPVLINVHWGIMSAIAAILPLLGLRSGDFQRLSWTNVAHILFMLGLLALAAGMCSLTGGELGGLIHQLHKCKAMDQGIVARSRLGRRIRLFEVSGSSVPVVVAVVAACASIIAAIIAKL